MVLYGSEATSTYFSIYKTAADDPSCKQLIQKTLADDSFA